MRFIKEHFVVAATAAFTIAQLLCLVVWGYTPYPDSDGYLSLARESIAQGGLYPTAVQMKEIPFIWNLGSINTLVLSRMLFGTFIPVHILFILMKGLSAWLVYHIAIHLTNSKAALLSFILYLIYPASYGEANSYLSEVPFTFFSLLTVYLFLKERYSGSGLSLGIANWYRPLGIILLIILLLSLLYKKRQALRPLCSILGVYIIVNLSIAAFNYQQTGYFFANAQTGWMALLQYSWDNDTDKQADYTLFEHNDPMYIPDNEHTDPISRNAQWRTNFFKWISRNKMEYVKQMPKKLVKTYVSDNTTFCTFLPQSYKQHAEYLYAPVSMPVLIKSFPRYSALQWLVVYNLLYYYLLLVLAAVGTCILLKAKDTHTTLITAGTILLYSLFLIILGHGETRFHIPLMPYVIILASIALMQAKSRLSKSIRMG